MIVIGLEGQMDVSRPATSVVPSLDAEVFMVLAGTTRPMTGREISRLVRRGSWSGVRNVLVRLVDHGLVNVQEAAPAMLYVLNRDHVAAPAVTMLADLRGELFRRARESVEEWSVRPVSVSVFGSTARGDGDLESDIDVFLVRPDSVDADDDAWREQVSLFSDAIARWTGNNASMIEVSKEEAKSMAQRGEPIVEDLIHDAVRLGGQPVVDVLRECSR